MGLSYKKLNRLVWHLACLVATVELKLAAIGETEIATV